MRGGGGYCLIHTITAIATGQPAELGHVVPRPPPTDISQIISTRSRPPRILSCVEPDDGLVDRPVKQNHKKNNCGHRSPTLMDNSLVVPDDA